MRSLVVGCAVGMLCLVGCGSSAEEGPGGQGGSAGEGGSQAGSAGGGQGGTSGGGQGGAAGTAGGGSGGTFTGETFSLTVGPLAVVPGRENTQCVVQRLSNPTPIHVGMIRNVISSSSHHLIVYKTNDTEERTTPFDCTPFLETLNPEAGAPLMVTQKYEDELRLPEGVAFTLDAHQMIRIELHYINTTTADVDVTATTSFHTMNTEDFQHEADFLFIGSPDISIPPRSQATLGPLFFKLPAGYADVNFFAITGHTHQYGRNVTVERTAGRDAQGESVYNVPGWRWDEPETVQHDPPFKVPDGGGFNFTCQWNNTSDQTVRFGESANQEMCFFWSYYYPSQGAKVCVVSQEYGVTECCPGGPLCGLIDDFLR
ncbi:MAG: hypothetical protein KIT72_07305 [Polyangiaceae bacterium]|nr:hypothetical protein [Polyangiaceae bacterium]